MEKFNDIKYTRPDSDEVKSKLLGIIGRFEKADSFEAAHSAFLDWEKTNSEIETMYVIAPAASSGKSPTLMWESILT